MASNNSLPSMQMAAILTCELCPRVYANPSELDRHRQIHDIDRIRNGTKARSEPATPGRANGRRYYYCPHCDTRLATRRSLKRHFDAFHAPGSMGANVPDACQRCRRFGLTCDGETPCRWRAMDVGSDHCTPPFPQALPSPDPTVSSGSISGSSISGSSISGSSVSWGPWRQIQRERLLRSNSNPVELGDSPQLSAALPPTPVQAEVTRPNLSWIGFPVSSVGRYETYSQSAGGSHNNSSELPDSDSLQSRRLSQAVAGVNPSGSNSPTDSLVESLNSLGLLFQEGGAPRQYKVADEQKIYLPGIELLRQLSSNYLVKWQQWQPVFHTGTWNFNECPMVLLSAMACIGSVLSEDSEMIDQGKYISARCASEISRMAPLHPEQGHPVEYYAALCLHQMYLLGTGEEELYFWADQLRGCMINGLRGHDMLGPNTDNLSSTSSQSSASFTSVDIEWRAWVNCEQKLRVAWMVFEHDCSLALFTTSPCAIELRHLPKRFPCNQTLYDAPDARAWAEIKSQSPDSVQGPLVTDIVAMAWEKSELPHGMSPWSKRLCTQIFEHVLRGTLMPDDIDATVAGARDLNLTLTPITSNVRCSLLWSISILDESIHSSAPTAPLSTGDSVNLCSSELTLRYNHMTFPPQTMFAIVCVARGAASPPSANSHASLRRAQIVLLGQFAEDPSYSRQYVLHVGRMLRATRNYSAIAPVDYLRIFTAYLVILAYVKYGPPSPMDVPETVSFVVDANPSTDEISDWLKFGGPATVGSCDRIYPRCSTEQIMEEARRILYRSDGWKITERLFNILAHFNDLEVLED
ncbi:hypothetical protein ACHAQJ_002507 [Trichoderma viride]